jgi:predicted NUDIX family NTP pyrophosphohydrolase
MPKMSAGLLMYKNPHEQLQVLLVHPGGPFYKNKDVWTIPKGEPNDREDIFKTALREFSEEIGFNPDPHGKFIPLGTITQKGGKTVHAWGFEGDVSTNHILGGGLCTLKWPPGSGKIITFQEIDVAKFFTVSQAKEKLIESQHPFLERLISQV